MDDYEILMATSKYPEIAKQELEAKVENYKEDGYTTSGGVSATTTTNEDGESQIVLTQVVTKND